MRLWYFSSSVNSFFKHARAAIQWDQMFNFGRTLRVLPFFMCANSEGSGETARMRRLAWTFAGRLCHKYHNLMSWLYFNDLGRISIICYIYNSNWNSKFRPITSYRKLYVLKSNIHYREYASVSLYAAVTSGVYTGLTLLKKFIH